MRSIFIMMVAICSFRGQADVAIQCGNLFDSKSGKLIGPHTIVTKENLISSVAAGVMQVPNMKNIDLAKMTCLPGFIDLHVHLSSESNPNSYVENFRLDDADFALNSVGFARKTLFSGFTTVRDLGGSVAINLRNAINQGKIIGPRIFAAGKAISSTGGHADPTNGWSQHLSKLAGPPGPNEGVVDGVDDARKAVRQRYKEGSDVIKITSTGGVLSYAKSADAPHLTLEEIKAIVKTANDYGFTVAAHAHGKEGAERAIIAGVTSIEHGTFMDEETFRLMRKHGTWYVPTLLAGDFVTEKSEIDGYFPEIVRPKAARVGPAIKETLRKAYLSGVKIAFGTDSGVSPHGGNAQEFILMNQAGIPPERALQAATFDAAKVLNETSIGQIAVGMKADIIAIAGNPIADIAVTKDVRFVMKDGQIYNEDVQRP